MLDKLRQNLIQYDEINSEVIYFLEIPYISIDKYNSLMEKNIEEKKRFIYLNKNNINTIKISTELNNILNIISLLKIEEHIINTIKLKSEQKNKIYIILSLKTPGKDQNGFFHFPALFQSLYRKNNEI